MNVSKHNLLMHKLQKQKPGHIELTTVTYSYEYTAAGERSVEYQYSDVGQKDLGRVSPSSNGLLEGVGQSFEKENAQSAERSVQREGDGGTVQYSSSVDLSSIVRSCQGQVTYGRSEEGPGPLSS
jgi:hypothetical protein